MSDKNFKVKTGIDLPSPLPISMGGTGQTSAENTLNSLLPLQTSAALKFLTTDGTATSWAFPNYSEVAVDGVPVNTRKTLNFIGASITDDSVNNKTNVTIGGSQYSQVLLVENITGMSIL